MNTSPSTIIESLGVYLPPRSVPTSEILEGCEKPLRFPLKKITGIENRHMAGENEFSIDLAQQAITECLANSRHAPADIDLLICCSISRYDQPNKLSFEPSTAVRLRKFFAFDNALAFDLSNACAGMFTGLYVADAFLEAGIIRRAMVVSGEYITHLTRTAQREIEGFMDSRLACLTLGDSGAAVILEKSRDGKSGFHKIDLRSFGRYSHFCIGKPSKETPGWVMYTDAVKMADVAIKIGTKYSLDVLKRAAWAPESFQHLIMHQTSRMTLNSVRREINLELQADILTENNTIDNLTNRGNTASTSHFVALADGIRSNEIQSGDKVVFNISASGLTCGTSLYILDDLPDRLRGKTPASRIEKPKDSCTSQAKNPVRSYIGPGLRVESLGVYPGGNASEKKEDLMLLKEAASTCLQDSSYEPSDIDVLIYAGVYRDGYIMEPAYAALLAGALDINAIASSEYGKNTFAFDVFNGSVGFLNACAIVQQLIATRKCNAALIAASETENNHSDYPEERLGIQETASALLLDAHPEQNRGFTRFLFRYDPDSIEDYSTRCNTSTNLPRLEIHMIPNLESKYIQCIVPAVHELLKAENLDAGEIDRVFPPQISPVFIARLSAALGWPLEKFVDVTEKDADLFTSSLPYALHHAQTQNLAKPGDTGLVIAVGSGLQAGCAIYYF